MILLAGHLRRGDGSGKRRANQDHAVILVSNKGGELSSAWPRYLDKPAARERAAPEQQFASDIITSRSDAAPPETVATAKIDATAVEPRRTSRARNRFAVFSIAASLVVAVCVDMYLRAEQDLRQSLLQERDRVAALTRELSKATEEADRLRQAANAASEELEQSAVGRPRLLVILNPRNA